MALKLTRKAFNRRLIAFALTVLTSVSLTTVGFTTFVVSTDANKSQGGNVEVSTITEASMNFVDVSLGDNPNFVFEAAKDDDTGRIRSDGTNFENLAVTLSGRLEHSQYLDYIGITLQLPDGIKQAIEDGFICAPVCVRNDGTRNGTEIGTVGIYYDETEETWKEVGELKVAERADYTATATGVISFSFTLYFEWGDQFGKMNPSIYFDTLGADESDDEMQGKLQAFRKMVYGLSEEDDPNASSEYYAEGYDIYYVIITAHTN
jgi:hypothetical protein